MKIKQPSKRTSVVLFVVVAVSIATGIYVWQSVDAWKGYESRLKSEEAAYINLRDEALGADSAESRLVAVRKLDEKLAGRADICAIHPVFAWQAKVIPVLKDGVARCEAKVRQLGLIAGPVRGLHEYLEATSKLQGIIATLTPGETLNESNWTKSGLERVQAVSTKLKALSMAGDAEVLKERALELNDALKLSWQRLIKANKDEDKTAFLTASTATARAYADYMELADIVDEQIQIKVADVTEAASKL